MKIGTVLEAAVWVTGEESPEMLDRFSKDLLRAVDRKCEMEGVLHGPLRMIFKHPSEDRVPAVPDHVQGICVRFLIGEADVVGYKPITSEGSFIANLDKKDLVRLRVITRQAAKKHLGDGHLTDQQCDEVIEELGPGAALDTLKDGVDRGLVH